MARPSTPPVDAGPDRRRDTDFLAAGLVLLADGGLPSVTVANLCRRLGVTKGSFYHHFDGVPDYRRRLLDHWAVARTDQLRAEIESEPDPLVRLDLLKRAAVGLEHEAERAIRAWAGSDAVAADAQREVDGVRELALTVAFADLGVSPDRGATLARIGLTILVGSQQVEEPVDRDRLTRLFDEYQRWILDAVPPT